MKPSQKNGLALAAQTVNEPAPGIRREQVAHVGKALSEDAGTGQRMV